MARGLTIANQRTLKVSGRSIVRSAIPDSGGDHQWNYTTGSGTTIEDVIGDVDAEYIDLSWSSNAGAGGSHGVLDGGDNIADLGSSTKSDWLHFITDQKGTLFSWIKPDTISDRQYLISAGYDGGQNNRSISFRLNGNSIEINVFDGEGNKLYEHSGGSIETSDWTAVAMAADGEMSKLFIAESDSYDVIKVSSQSVSSDLGFGDLDGNALFGGAEFVDGSYGGGKDITFKDSIGWTESELQDFVDNTKKFYT